MTTARLARWCQRANGPLMARKLNNYTVKLKRQSGLIPLTCVKALGAGDGNRTRIASLEVQGSECGIVHDHGIGKLVI